jgi:hypothetical protein
MHQFGVARSGKIECLAILITVVSFGIAAVLWNRPANADDVTTQAILNFDLGTTNANVSILGASSEDHLSGNGVPGVFTSFPRAHAIATGDFNGDNIDDVLIGAPDADFTPTGGANRAGAGAAYVVFGRQNFVNPTIIDANLAAQGQPDIRIFGATADENLGFAVAAGDVNGDGTDDIIVGAPGADLPAIGANPARPDTGAIFIILGSNTLTATTIDLATPNAASVAFFGERTGDRFGSAIAVGNVGGTATADILVGAPMSQGPDPAGSARANGGAAYVIFGGPGLNRTGAATSVIDLGTTTATVRVYGRTGSLLGSSMAIGDVNAGGAADLIVGAPLEDRPELASPAIPAANDTGAVFVVFGGANLNPTAPATTKIFDIASAAAAERPSASIFGATADDHLGASVAAGDVSGDGSVDLIAGAPDADARNESLADAGEVYVFTVPGNINPPAGQTERRIDVGVNAVNLTVFGAQAGAHLGEAVAAGRVNTVGNNDTITDLLLGSPGFDGAGKAESGAVSIIFGGASLLQFDRDLALGQDDIRIIGQLAGDELGWALGAGDIDNNTGGDIIVGAPFNDTGVGAARVNAGRVYVLLATGDNIPPVNQNPTVQVTAPNGTEILVGGTNFNITWTASDPNGDGTIERFEIRLSTDAGASFNTIIASNVAGSARQFTWAVPLGINTNQARIRVIAFDNAGGQAQDDSNANFTITDAGAAVTLTAPNGGETLRFGQTFRIMWTVPDGLAAQVRGFDLFLSTNGGASFSFIIAFVNPATPALAADVRFFDWQVPNICTSQARVLVAATTLTGSESIDVSDANFTIADVGPTINTADMRINNSGSKLILRTIQPVGGTEVRFADNVVGELSSDAAGTQFFTFSRSPKVKSSGRKLELRGTINGQTINAFFPDAAIRVLRITNPPCAVTVLRVQRQGNNLVVVAQAAGENLWP